MRPPIRWSQFRIALIVIALSFLAIGTCVALTDPAPATLPLRVGRWLATRSWRMSSPSIEARTTINTKIPDDWDSKFDDSGYATAVRFTKPNADPYSLVQMRESVLGRGKRGIEYLQSLIANTKPGDPKSPAATAAVDLVIASLMMHEGRWSEASDYFAAAQSADPSRPALFRAKLDALRGVAALRRGEIENCVACCNEASCIFPLAAAAIHQRTAGSREAIEHFTRSLQQEPEDPGVQWLLNVAYMTLGEYPTGVPPEHLLPLGRFAAAGDDPRRMVNVASKVELNARGESTAGACLVDDFDGDGRLDVFMPTTEPERGAMLLRNRGDGASEEVSDSAGLNDQVLSLNACHADFDNDGDLDILMLRGAWDPPIVPRPTRRLRHRDNRGATRLSCSRCAANQGAVRRASDRTLLCRWRRRFGLFCRGHSLTLKHNHLGKDPVARLELFGSRAVHPPIAHGE
jgi:tetratricopeptide (TPR) repeat protein